MKDQAAWYDLVDRWAEEGRDVQLFNLHGQSIFPIYSVVGSLLAYAALYPIKRGEGDRCPVFEGAFPSRDQEIVELGRGWRVMCVTVNPFAPPAEVEKKLEAAALRLQKEGQT